MRVSRSIVASVCVVGTACGGGGVDGPPRVHQLDLSYQRPAGYSGEPSAACLHHYGPDDLTVVADFGRAVLPRAGQTPSTVLENVPVGTHWVYVVDVGLCPQQPSCPAATDGVRVSGVLLTRRISVDANACQAFEFMVSPQGEVSP